MNVRWSPTALRDIESLHSYVADDSLSAAIAAVERILSAIDALSRYPEMGRAGRVTGTRELIVFPYLIAYRLKGGAIEIVAILHGSRRWPDSF
jgi:toxin ParE1/3/4